MGEAIKCRKKRNTGDTDTLKATGYSPNPPPVVTYVAKLAKWNYFPLYVIMAHRKGALEIMYNKKC